MQRNFIEQEESNMFYSGSYDGRFTNEDGLRLAISRLSEFGRVLYVGAHPDDENNKLIAYLTNERFFDTAYLSITRGEGGQNFIGSESGDELGVLRVQESLQARRVDGGKQFFTGAKDYGFSKCAGETISMWGEQETLRDIVFIIRDFQPDIIVSRFSPTLRDKHGHHQAAAILMEKAFVLAADAHAFPEQLHQVAAWQPKQMLWNVYAESGVKDIGGQIQPTAAQFPLFIPAKSCFLEQSYTELAAESRNQHRCQAMVSLANRTASFEYFEWIAGAAITDEGVFNFQKGNEYSADRQEFVARVEGIIRALDAGQADEQLVKQLLALLEFTDLCDNDSKIVDKRLQLIEILTNVLGLEATLSVDRAQVCPGDIVPVSLRLLKNNLLPVRLLEARDLSSGILHEVNVDLKPVTKLVMDCLIPANSDFAQPAWLKNGSVRGRYLEQELTQLTFKTSVNQLVFDLDLEVMGQRVTLQVPVIAGRSNAFTFLRKTPVVISPPVYGTFKQNSLLITNNKLTEINLSLKSCTAVAETGKVRLLAGAEVDIFPSVIDFELKPGEDVSLSFFVNIAQDAWEGEIGFEIEIAGRTYGETSVNIDYPHIIPQQYFTKGRVKVAKSAIDIAVKKIAYIRGKEDTVAAALQEIVEQVDVFDVPTFLTKDIQKYEAVVLGIRLYNCTGGCHWHFDKKLKSYVEAGGLVISQYNTDYDLNSPSLGPYGIKLSSSRITNADSPVHFLQKHRVLNYPNRLTAQDFRYWSHDRALFLPSSWDSDFEPILQGGDSSGDVENGLLLVAKKGNGHYIYTALSLFRQLPLAVPGAFRLFANMLSLR